MFKINKTVIIIIIITFFVLIAILFFALMQTKTLHRAPSVLMDRYNLLKQSNPDSAKNALLVILNQDSNYIPALKELSQLYLKNNRYQEALPLVVKLHQLLPDDPHYTSQLAHIYYESGEEEKAHSLFEELKTTQIPAIALDATTMLDKMASFIAPYNTAAVVVQKTPSTKEAINEQSIVARILLDYFYKLHNESSPEADPLLMVLASMSPDNPALALELGYRALKGKDDEQAIFYFSWAYNEKPSAQIALQLAYLYTNIKNYPKASEFFLLAMTTSDDPKLKNRALKGFELAKQNKTLPELGKTKVPEITQMLDQYFLLKKVDKGAAWSLIQKIIYKYPNNVMALKEGGFLAIDLGHRIEAITYLARAYSLTYDATLAMQLGYLYDQTSDKYTAYQYFKLATHTNDKKLELRAQNALTNLAGLQTKVLHPPYFGELFFTPFTQDRFGLTVRPIIARYGIEQDNKLQSKLYFAFRQTDDNRSTNLGQIPQIYEDNVRIIGGGLQITPIKSIPLIAFIEAGGAYDLFFRNRPRWRGDVRGGVVYYNEWGAQPAYFDQVKISTKYYSFFYSDITYFSRFQNNVIGTFKTHQGIRLIQYHSSMVNLYLTGRVIQDSNRDFFNNIFEIGPGLGFIPSNRFRVEIRFEHINGTYLPARSFNPYGKHYTNDMAQLLYYVRI